MCVYQVKFGRQRMVFVVCEMSNETTGVRLISTVGVQFHVLRVAVNEFDVYGQFLYDTRKHSRFCGKVHDFQEYYFSPKYQNINTMPWDSINSVTFFKSVIVCMGVLNITDFTQHGCPAVLTVFCVLVVAVYVTELSVVGAAQHRILNNEYEGHGRKRPWSIWRYFTLCLKFEPGISLNVEQES